MVYLLLLLPATPASGTCVGCSVTKTSVLRTCSANSGKMTPETKIVWRVREIGIPQIIHFHDKPSNLEILHLEKSKTQEKNAKKTSNSRGSHSPHWAPSAGCWCCASRGWFPPLSWPPLRPLLPHWLPPWHPQQPSEAPADWDETGVSNLGFQGSKWMVYGNSIKKIGCFEVSPISEKNIVGFISSYLVRSFHVLFHLSSPTSAHSISCHLLPLSTDVTYWCLLPHLISSWKNHLILDNLFLSPLLFSAHLIRSHLVFSSFLCPNLLFSHLFLQCRGKAKYWG